MVFTYPLRSDSNLSSMLGCVCVSLRVSVFVFISVSACASVKTGFVRVAPRGGDSRLIHSLPLLIKPLCHSPVLQPLTVTTPSLNTAENMADLIDGYCRLVNGSSQSFIVRPQKGRHVTSVGSLAAPSWPGGRNLWVICLKFMNGAVSGC